MPSDNVRRVRSKSDLEPELPPVDLHIAKRRKTITGFDDSNHEKTVEDRYNTYVESAKVPITTVLKPPPPIDTPSEITDEFLKLAINYASDRLNFRRVTPRTATILRRYLELAETVKATQIISDKVRLEECHRMLHSKAFLLHEPSKDEMERDEALRSLLILRYYLEYGDYVAEYCREFRDKAIAVESEGQDCFTQGKNWVEVQKELEKEAESCEQWHRQNKREPVPETPMTDAINRACANGNYDITHVTYSIKWYSDRNEQAHNGVSQMIQRCEFHKLGNRLFSDLKSIPRVLGVPDQAMMEKVVESIRDRFFVQVRQEDSVLNQHALKMFARREEGKASKIANAQAAKDQKQKADAKTAAKIRRRARQSKESSESVYESVYQDRATQTQGMGTGDVEQNDAESGKGDDVNIVVGR